MKSIPATRRDTYIHYVQSYSHSQGSVFGSVRECCPSTRTWWQWVVEAQDGERSRPHTAVSWRVSRSHGHVGQPRVWVLLVAVVIDLHLVPARLSDVVEPPLDASPVQVQHHEEHHPDQSQDNTEEHVRDRLQVLVHTIHVLPPEPLHGDPPLRLRLGAQELRCVRALGRVLQPVVKRLQLTAAPERVQRQVHAYAPLSVEAGDVFPPDALYGVIDQHQRVQIIEIEVNQGYRLQIVSRQLQPVQVAQTFRAKRAGQLRRGRRQQRVVQVERAQLQQPVEGPGWDKLQLIVAQVQ